MTLKHNSDIVYVNGQHSCANALILKSLFNKMELYIYASNDTVTRTSDI